MSPAELSMGRQLDDNLPKFHSPRPKIAKRNLLQEREKSKQLHDKHISTKTSTKETFTPGMRVAIQDHQTKEWTIRGKILRKAGPRSFDILTDGRKELRRTQTHIRKVHAIIVSATQPEGGFPVSQSQLPLPPVLEGMQLMSDSEETVPYSESSSEEEETFSPKEILMSDSDETVPYNVSSSSEEEETFSQKKTPLRKTKSGRVVRQPYRYR